EFWDVIQQATGKKPSTFIWYVGPTEEEEIGVYRWALANHPEAYHDWTSFQHPQLGTIEIGGWDEVFFWSNAPGSRLLAEVKPHAEFAVHQALCSPRLEVLHTNVVSLGGDSWRVEVGVANTGWLPTFVTQWARDKRLVLPIVAELSGATVAGGTARQEIGQLGGRLDMQFAYGKSDGSPDRGLVTWVVQAPAGTTVDVSVVHQRAGSTSVSIALG
ncbi:MAG: hypothetical protein RI900_3392, partial [Actinomycetota bacterium]